MRASWFVLWVLTLCLSSTAARAQGQSAVLLMTAKGDQGTVSTFGPGAVEGGPLARTITAPLKKAGVGIVSAKAASTEPTRAGNGLPMGDESAIACAVEVGASIAVLVGVEASDDGPVRATRLVGQRARVRIRVLDVSTRRSLFDGKGEAASYGREATLARSQASSKAITRASRGLAANLIVRAPNPQQSGALVLTVQGADSWRAIATIIRSLAATRGVSDMHALEIRPDRIVFSLRSMQGAAQVVAGLRRAQIRNGSLSVQLAGNALDVRVVMNSPSILPPRPNG